MKDWSKQDDWFWEGNVQLAISNHLVSQGYTVASANTLIKEHGPDILASKDNEKLLIEVKGWPSDKYVDGPRVGLHKKTQPTTQAKHWFSEAIFSLMKAQTQYPDHRLIIGLPDFPRYRNLISGTSISINRLGFEVWIVNNSGSITKLK